MKKNYLFILTSLLASCFLFLSCDKDDDDDNFHKLLGTWRLTNFIHYDKNGVLISDNPYTLTESYVTFTSHPYDDDPSKYLIISDEISTFTGKRSYKNWWTFINNTIKSIITGGEVYSVNNNELLLKEINDNSDGYRIDKYVKAIEPEHEFIYSGGGGNSGGGNSGGNNNGDVPYIISFNYTATKSSITVKFIATERPTSASIKYGASSASKSASTDIAGKQISATVNGLKAGTKYYFKCKVSNSYGSSTSDEYPAMTNY